MQDRFVSFIVLYMHTAIIINRAFSRIYFCNMLRSLFCSNINIECVPRVDFISLCLYCMIIWNIDKVRDERVVHKTIRYTHLAVNTVQTLYVLHLIIDMHGNGNCYIINYDESISHMCFEKFVSSIKGMQHIINTLIPTVRLVIDEPINCR